MPPFFGLFYSMHEETPKPASAEKEPDWKPIEAAMEELVRAMAQAGLDIQTSSEELVQSLKASIKRDQHRGEIHLQFKDFVCADAKQQGSKIEWKMGISFRAKNREHNRNATLTFSQIRKQNPSGEMIDVWSPQWTLISPKVKGYIGKMRLTDIT